MDAQAPDASRARLAADTSREVEDLQVDAWRRLSSVDIARTLNAAWSAGSQIAWFGLKERYPAASDDELRVRFAVLTLGPEMAARIHPGASAFVD